MKTKICVVSYKRPKNNTCDLLLNSEIKEWYVYCYSFDPFIEEYKNNYGSHVREIIEFDKASLPNKRQLVLDDAINENYDFCVMLDDDIYLMKNLYSERELTIEVFIDSLIMYMTAYQEYVALSACYNQSDDLIEISDYKNVCNNSIFNLKQIKESNVRYNTESKCEDMEFAIDLMLKGYKTGRLEHLLGKNDLQGGTTNDGLSYRFAGTNRFIEEAEYMSTKYPELKDVFEYDENHFKINTKLLKNHLQK